LRLWALAVKDRRTIPPGRSKAIVLLSDLRIVAGRHNAVTLRGLPAAASWSLNQPSSRFRVHPAHRQGAGGWSAVAV